MYKTIQQSIEAYFKANWTYTPIAWENVSFNPDIYEEWVRVSTQFADEKATSLGARCYRILGILYIQVFIRASDGNARLMELVDSVCDLFRDVTNSNITYRQPSVSKSFDKSDGDWFQATIACSFHYDFTE